MNLFEEYESILMSMTEHHSIFYKLWSITKPMFNNDTPTACVYFDKNGAELIMNFNPSFWQSLNHVRKQFVVCHETLHILLNHGKRSINDNRIHDLINTCQDIVINELLVRMYGFVRSEIDPNNEYCWADTVFPNDPSISTDESFEYYFNLLYKQQSENNSKLPTTVDDHDSMDTSGDINKITESMTREEKEHINDIISQSYDSDSDQIAGTFAGNQIQYINLNPPKVKKKWETVIKKWTEKCFKSSDRDVEQWVLSNRRMVNLSSDLMLPSEYEVDAMDQDFDKINIWFFLDTSGSCKQYAKRFFTAANSLSPKKFDIRLFCFDTKVYETTLESKKLYGFGGTRFHILEDYIQTTCKRDKIKYPMAIFVITDGYGNYIHPQYPKNWHWFLTENSTHIYIPSESKTYKLNDFE